MNAHIDTTHLCDEQFVRSRWDEHVANVRRDLLRLAWAQILFAKAVRSGERFRDDRITYPPQQCDRGSVRDQ